MTAEPFYRDAALGFACSGQTLQGVLTTPANRPMMPLGVVVVVGGPQYRIGSHRHFVTLARRLATEGYPVLRFDVRGMGDSEGAPRGFEHLGTDIDAAIGAIARTTGVERVVLWGLCDGASASLMYADATRDVRVAGLAMLNPWVRSEHSLARTHVKHYYRTRLVQPSFWAKLLRGGVGLQALKDLWANITSLGRRARSDTPQEAFQQRMARGWQRFPGSLLVLLSDDDWTAKEFDEQFHSTAYWATARDRTDVHWHRIVPADHTLSEARARALAEQLTLSWLGTLR